MEKINYKIVEFDGIIIGCGGAGSRAAIEAYDAGSKVALIAKCRLGKAHTVMAEGGMAAAVGADDGPKAHFVDTIIGGMGINDWKKVWKLVNGGKDCIRYLESNGAIFDRNPEGVVSPRAFGGHSSKRVCHISDRTGHVIIHTLKNDVLKRDIKLFEKTMITSVITRNQKVIGATALDIQTGEFILFKVNFVIIATGGNGAIYKYTTNSKDLTGDGVFLAYEAGAQLMDMEMVQFHPTCMVEPEEKKGILVTEACRGEGGILINSKGERFMKNAKNPDGTQMYEGKLGHPELEARDVVSRAIEKEYAKNNGPVRLCVCKNSWKNEIKNLNISPELQELVDDSTMLDDSEVHKKLSSMVEQFEKFSQIDITKEAMVVRPANHYMMGGVKTDAETCQTIVKGLYAAGEVGSGVHGANRLGGNSLTDIQVEGAVAGKHAAEYSRNAKHEECKGEAEREFLRLLALLGEGKIKHSVIQQELKELMWANVGMKRDKEGLIKTIEKLEELQKKAKNLQASGGRECNTAWQESIETVGMLVVAEAVARCSLEREESRGAHFRTDFPQRRKNWVLNIICERNNYGKMILERQSVPEIPPELKSLLPVEKMKKVYGE